jgi:simple sugar transport system permease protein
MACVSSFRETQVDMRGTPMNWRGLTETLSITVAALVVSLLVFGAFIWSYAGVSPFDVYYWMYMGAFGTRFSWQNTLTRAAPLMLTALCTALPARLGLIVIGGEGALVLGGLAAVAAGLLLAQAPVFMIQISMVLAGMLAGGLVIVLVGMLRDRFGVNETIASLLIAYVVFGVFNFIVESPDLMRDPASLNKPSTYPIAEEAMMGKLPGIGVHWGLAFGVVYCVAAFILMHYTTYGFAVRMVGGNVRAAMAAGLPVSWLIVISCLLAGGAAGLAGAVEVGAVHRQANASLMAGYGFTGILVSFIARHHPLGIIPAAILFGGLSASSGLLQRRLLLPDASVDVLKGMIFVTILLFETFYGRFKVFQMSMAFSTSAGETVAPAPKPAIAEAVAK